MQKMIDPDNKTISELVEERRKEIRRLVTGALTYLGVEKYDVSVLRRRKIDIFDPDEAVFFVKADTVPVLNPEQVSFVKVSLQNMGYSVKRVEQRDDRLLMFV